MRQKKVGENVFCRNYLKFLPYISWEKPYLGITKNTYQVQFISVVNLNLFVWFMKAKVYKVESLQFNLPPCCPDYPWCTKACELDYYAFAQNYSYISQKSRMSWHSVITLWLEIWMEAIETANIDLSKESWKPRKCGRHVVPKIFHDSFIQAFRSRDLS